VSDGTLSLSGRQYRRLDVLSKLVGLAAIALALDVGIASAPGLALAVTGLLVGVSTVFVTKSQ
jgi:hypothetical protein